MITSPQITQRLLPSLSQSNRRVGMERSVFSSSFLLREKNHLFEIGKDVFIPNPIVEHNKMTIHCKSILFYQNDEDEDEEYAIIMIKGKKK